MLSQVVRWFQNLFHVPVTKTLNQLLAALFQHVTGSEILQQGEGTSFPRPSALSSQGFAFLPFYVKIVQVWVWNKEVSVVNF